MLERAAVVTTTTALLWGTTDKEGQLYY